MVDLRHTANKTPQPGGKVNALLLQAQISTRIGADCYQLATMTHQSGIQQQLFQLKIRHLCHQWWRKVMKAAAIVCTLAQDHQPAQTSLLGFQAELFKQLVAVMAGHAPLAVVIKNIIGMGAGPGANIWLVHWHFRNGYTALRTVAGTAEHNQQVTNTGDNMTAPELRGLYAITDSQLLAGGRLLPWCEAALRGGARLLQYRDKSSDQQRRYREASQLQELCQRYAAQLVINDDLQLARRIGCGLHLGQADGSLATARQQLGNEAIVGATCHHQLQLAGQAVAAGASYVGFGRFFGSQAKPGAILANTALLAAAAKMPVPVVAIGGIT